MRYRIVECKEDNKLWFKVQKKFLWWWFDETDFDVDVMGYAHNYVMTFSTIDEADEYIRMHGIKITERIVKTY